MSVSDLAFALMSGLTVSGMAGSLMELVAGRPISFSEPYFSSRRVVRSFVSAALAGPMMLANDAIFARREGAISRSYLGFCALTALVWAGALGIVVVSLATRLPALPS